MENTEIPMAERLTAVQNFGFLVKIPIAKSLTPDFGMRLWFPVRDFRSSVVEGLCNFMVKILDKIRSIDGSKETLKLAVRITYLWFVGTPNKSEQAEMIFVDFEGDQIHAICKSDHLKSWKADLKENCTYVMHNFKVVKNDGSYPASVTNSFKASKLLINDPILEIQEFKERKTNIQTGPFTCGCGKDNDQPVLRVKIEDDDLDLNASPQALDKLLGHVLAFKVRIQSRFKNLVVLKYSKDLDLINAVLEMLPNSETCFKIDPSNVDCNDATHAECQFLSATADHDPVAGLPLTPKRRMSSDEADDELGSSQISPAQILSNKLTRHSHRS
ncbi:hypothetical protein JHK87_043376 [Glycine soja]|nr:hypothetical protein JHK87_043376 [Glycine soja]